MSAHHQYRYQVLTQARERLFRCTLRQFHEEYCPYARDYGLKLARTQLLRNLINDDAHQDPDRVYQAAVQHELCPFEVSLDLLSEIDVLVCDYNYVFDPDIGLAAILNQGALRDAVLVIDEAHNLVDRSREYYSPALGSPLLDRARTTDLLACDGNRRFLAILPNTVLDGGRIFCQRLLEEARALRIGAPDDQPLPALSLSCGIVQYGGDSPAPELLARLIALAQKSNETGGTVTA